MYLREIKRNKFRLTNNLIKRYSVFTHGLLEKQVFSFHLYYFSFYFSFRLVRKLVFLFFNVNVYLMEIPCLNKVTIPYHTIHDRRPLLQQLKLF